MEFKLKLVKTQKAKKAQRKKDGGMKRVKVRGRKRWIRTAKKQS